MDNADKDKLLCATYAISNNAYRQGLREAESRLRMIILASDSMTKQQLKDAVCRTADELVVCELRNPQD